MSVPFILFIVCLGFARAAAVAGDTARELTADHLKVHPRVLEKAWPHLDSPDPAVREAARRTIEAQPFDSWKQRALGETHTQAALEALLALARACPPAQAEDLRPHICEGISTLHLEEMSVAQRLAAVRLTRLACTRLGPPSADERAQMTDLWTHFLPPRTVPGTKPPLLEREIRELLNFLSAQK
ncbi:MAG: hypothetical protein K8R23_09930 [Chthoniobacter sp.]|nr:hypothetical protein [Chthoniobacter sp.]